MKKNALLFIFLFFSAGTILGQSNSFTNAKELFETKNYAKSILAFENLIKIHYLPRNNKIEAKTMLAEAYFFENRTEEAQKELEALFAEYPESKEDLLLTYAKVLAANGNLQEAEQIFSSIKPNELESELYQQLEIVTTDPNCFSVERISLNTSKDEHSAAFFKDGIVYLEKNKNNLDYKYVSINEAINSNLPKLNKAKVGSERYTPSNAQDSKTLGVSKQIFNKAKVWRKLNSSLNEGPAVFFKDKIYFSRNNNKNGTLKANKEGVSKIKIYEANLQGNKWTNIKELPFNSDEYSTGHPALSVDGKTLIFASDRPNGIGKTDLYKSTLTENGWSTPENLGPEINSEGNEMFPYIDENNLLYFSSDGLPGLGMQDLFFADLTSLSKPVNLGEPFNSAYDDFSLITDKSKSSGFFSSNRNLDGKDDDIFYFRNNCQNKEGCKLIIAAENHSTGLPIQEATVTISNLSQNKVLETKTEIDGSVTYPIINQGDKLTIEINHSRFKPKKFTYTIENCESGISRIQVKLESGYGTSQQKELLNADQ